MIDWEKFEKRFLRGWGEAPSKRERMEKDIDLRKVEKEVFDEYTVDTLYKLALRGQIDFLGGTIATGKEGNVFKGWTKQKEARALKIYRISTGNFQSMWEYIDGDERFTNVKKHKRDIVFAWCKKEFANLKLAYAAGVKVPKPYFALNNILVMEFIGDEFAAPLLKDVSVSNPEKIFWKIAEYVKILYENELVHADVSEYNVMMDGETPVLIDMGGGVPLTHPKAKEFLRRDVANLARYFKKLGVKADEDELFEYVTKK